MINTLLESKRQKLIKIARLLNKIEINKVKKECYLMRQDNTIYSISIISFFKLSAKIQKYFVF